MSEAESYVAKWQARVPGMELALVFCPAPQRAPFRYWGALQNELDGAALEVADPGVAQAKLAWWCEELERGAQGVGRHPLLRELLRTPEATRVDPGAWPRLASQALALTGDEQTPVDLDALLDSFRAYAGALAAIESQLFGIATPVDALAIERVLRGWRSGLAGGPARGLRAPLQLRARHQVEPGGLTQRPPAPAARALLRDLAAALLARLPQTQGPLFRRCSSALDAWLLRRWARGDAVAEGPGRLASLGLLWRAARSAPRSS